MRKTLMLMLLALCSTSALAELNPFLPPEARQTESFNSGMPVTGPSGIALPTPAAVSPQAKKQAELQGARMVAIINGKEVWYKPDAGIYVRYDVDDTSKKILEAQTPDPGVEAVEKKIAEVQKTAQKPTKQAKQW
ncbi:hypothetical protein [Pseudomonas amygdali]|uniref:Lipoprotein n=2 Tax=Pseudomonas amygdali pv. lachrymans TaxID=53707 RepID=A0AAD0M4W3_PSEAV|nr:hypothetical protein [Pseudomonas amygdali]AXH59394.1 hypothetical protein PLA107_029655 [Pseudomonas amygdali pv. lachrymans str. M301315]RMT05688.1 hypothetical protein ALP54_03331 [Pseudomonas amygdali pv. lachrymans]